MKVTIPIKFYCNENDTHYVEDGPPIDAVMIMEDGIGITIMNADATTEDDYLECIIGPKSRKFKDTWDSSTWDIRWEYAVYAQQEGIFDSNELDQWEQRAGYGSVDMGGSVGPSSCAFMA